MAQIDEVREKGQALEKCKRLKDELIQKTKEMRDLVQQLVESGYPTPWDEDFLQQEQGFRKLVREQKDAAIERTEEQASDAIANMKVLKQKMEQTIGKSSTYDKIRKRKLDTELDKMMHTPVP